MNIPLNIDWQQIALHLFNFMILLAGLYILLYKPVSSFIEKRKEHYMQQALQAEMAEASITRSKLELNEKLRKADEEIAARIKQKEEEAETALEARRAEVEAACEALLSHAREEAEDEKQRIIDSARDEIAQLAIEAVGRILSSSNRMQVK